MADENDHIHLDGEEARAGATPHVTRYVLGISLVLLIVIYAWIVLA
ncbi:hypothetical protein DFR49_1605 [Hephaestia caeni]|uniref:Uncharacterized protein n=1 Tax=Hephaestia caeni TaxID=645617 RepID=A0A397PBW0_9SPHN|nr:hypothetical protein [Hephaestia caeni]RIA47040.1 hypothetical protein DFR49_1605 [Hephaestia caeni]